MRRSRPEQADRVPPVAASCCLRYGIPDGIVALEHQAVSRRRQIGCDPAIARLRRAVEEHALDPDMVVKPLEMAHSRRGTGDSEMQRRRAMTGEVDVKG